MNALLFALVDAVLRCKAIELSAEAASCHRFGNMSPRMVRRAWTACDRLGWWRSLWPLGGGA
ncbi:hypothetical protein Mx8p33 [Myxococcus phage Mx8]|uniref:p33 n=1 Tax=Myxococcus phage Mx8 TaxID=49964 RepID=Q94MT6_9CAUD|nr:hypothetical protein Mx8p33 [Myxococcus phage Mx8]AAK94368.1 p33 [Myxococcus phage Mx8]